MIGIYKITNKKNGKVYIGQSNDMVKRKNSHFNALRKNKHDNVHLQNSFNKYGECNFSFEVLEECSEDELNDLEIKYIKEYNSTDRKFGFNIRDGGSSGSLSEETKMKLSKARATISFDEVSEIKQMLCDGFSREYIAEKYNIKKANIDSIARCDNFKRIRPELNKYIYKKTIREREKTREEIINLLYKGMGNKEISETLNVSVSIVEKTKSKYTNLIELELIERQRNYDRVISLKESGLTLNEIQSIMEIPNSTISKYYYGKSNPYKELPFKKATKEVVNKIIESGIKDPHELSKKFDLSITTVKDILYKYVNTEQNI